MAINLLFEVVSPTIAFALTDGPYQAEFTSFEPASASEMVDLFSGDFKYNIPLMDVDGYPLNISYHAGQTMDQEASWVGLGWGLNPGALNRGMKGLPDAFDGEIIKSQTNIRKHETIGIGGELKSDVNGSVAIYSAGVGLGTGLSSSFMVAYDNSKGFDVELHVDRTASVTVMALLC